VLDDTDVFSTYDVAPTEEGEEALEEEDPPDDEERAFPPQRSSGLDAALETF
jgi:hypothetical protein